MKLDTKVISVEQATGSPDEIYIRYSQGGAGAYYRNPIKIREQCIICGKVHYAETETLICFRRYMFDRIAKDPEYRSKIKGLYKKILVCTCKPNKCHGDILAEAAQRLQGVPTENKMTTHEKSDKNAAAMGRVLPMVNGKLAPISAIQPAPMKVEVVKAPQNSTATSTGTKIQATSTQPINKLETDDEIVVTTRSGTKYDDKKMVLFVDDHNRVGMIADGYIKDAVMFGLYTDRTGRECYEARLSLKKEHLRKLMPLFENFLKEGTIDPNDKKESEEEKFWGDYGYGYA